MGTAFKRGMILYHRGRWELAVREFQSALAEDAGLALAHAMLGMSHFQLKQYETATREVRQALKLGPDLAYPYFAMAFVAINGPFLIEPGVTRIDNARSLLQKAIAIEPNNPSFLSLLAQVEQAAQVWTSCLRAADRGLKVQPTHDECLCFRALALWHLKRRSEAMTVIGQALANNPESSQAHRILGWMLLSRDRKASIEHVSQALRLDPHNTKAQLLWRRLKGTPLQRFGILARRCGLIFFLLFAVLAPIWTLSFFGSPNPADSPDYVLFIWDMFVVFSAVRILKRFNAAIFDPVGYGFSGATIWIFLAIGCWMATSTAIAVLYHRMEGIRLMETPWVELVLLAPPVPLFLLEYALRLRRQSPPMSTSV